MSAQHMPGPFSKAEQQFIDRMFCHLMGAGVMPSESDVLDAARAVIGSDQKITRALFAKDQLRAEVVGYLSPRIHARAVVKESLTTQPAQQAVGQVNRALFECLVLEGRAVSSLVARAAIQKATGSQA